jgi:hypothetical protein
MRRGVVIAILGIVLSALTSCRAISSLLHDQGVVAQAEGVKLYRAELDALIPKGLSPEDSTELARKYITTWASDLIYQKVAQQQLSKSERDVTKELEDYRKSLLKYRYEQLYVNERLDTAVADELVEEYYAAHPEKFMLQRPLLRARYLNIAKDSPAIKSLKKMMKSSDPNDLVEADSIAYSSALKFSTWNNDWIDAASLAGEFGTDYNSMLNSMSGGWIEYKDTTGFIKLAYVPEMIAKGRKAPVEYSAPIIKDMIISARKQALISGLERDLLNDARENGNFTIYGTSTEY